MFWGVGFSTHCVMPWSIVPDAMELDYAEREGTFYGIWNFMNKLGVAVPNGITGWVLAAFGYAANVQQTESAKLGIQLLVGPIAAVFFIASVIVLSFYPITRRYYETVITPRAREWDRKKRR